MFDANENSINGKYNTYVWYTAQKAWTETVKSIMIINSLVI